MSVWRTFITQATEANAGRPNFAIDEVGIIEFARKHYKKNPESSRWNGRQIRNAFHTAIAMAEYQARAAHKINVKDPEAYGEDVGDLPVNLGKEQFKVLSRSVKQFDDYMKDTMGTSYEQKAEDEMIRKAKVQSKKKKHRKSKSKRRDSTDSSDSSSSSEVVKKRKGKKSRKSEKKTADNTSSSNSTSSSD